MKKQIIITSMIICLISLVTAFYPAETITIDNEMGIENLVYTIVGNSSPIGNLSIIINSTNISITFPSDMIPDSFTIVFLEEQTKEVIKTIYSGGGGGSTRYIDKNVTVSQPVFYDRNITIIQDCNDTQNLTKEIYNKEENVEIGIIQKIVLILLMLLGFLMIIVPIISILAKRIKKDDKGQDM